MQYRHIQIEFIGFSLLSMILRGILDYITPNFIARSTALALLIVFLFYFMIFMLNLQAYN